METATTTTPTLTTTWALDPSHSEIVFKVKHLMISNVKGEFKKLNAQIITLGSDFANAKVQATIDAASVSTNDDGRDAHLRGADFFDVEKHPELTFTGSSFKHISGSDYKLIGELRIKGVARPVELDVDFGGINKDPWGHEKAGFSVSGKINRKDWGLNWNAALETGGVLVSEDVRIHAELQFVKQ